MINIIPMQKAILFFLFALANASQACERPKLADAISNPLRHKKIFVVENYSPFPGNAENCIYTATWISEVIELGGNVTTYVATYRKSDKEKISEATFETSSQWIWFAPQSKVDNVAFALGDNIQTFGLRTDMRFVGGTFGKSTEQFHLVLDNGKGQLQSILSSTSNTESYQRDCEYSECDEDDVTNEEIFIVKKNKTNGMHDIAVKTYERLSQPTQHRKDRSRLLSSVTRWWNGKSYD